MSTCIVILYHHPDLYTGLNGLVVKPLAGHRLLSRRYRKNSRTRLIFSVGVDIDSIGLYIFVIYYNFLLYR